MSGQGLDVLTGEVLEVGQLSLFELADVANREHQLALAAGMAMIEHAILAGEALIEAKAQCGHGSWLPWLKANFEASERTARNYMTIAAPANRQRVADLEEPSLRRALDVISADAAGRGLNPGTFSSTTYECYTPEDYVEAVREVLGAIDLDPASADEQNENIKAATYYTKEIDGLTQPWHGRLFLNPPYGRSLTSAFVTRAVQEYDAGNVTAAIMVLNAYGFDAAWFRPLFKHTLCFTDHRIRFYGGGPTFGSLFVYLGQDRGRFIRVFSRFGDVVDRARP